LAPRQTHPADATRTKQTNTMKTLTVPTSRRGGFTLIELLVVISIIAILAGLLFPNFGAILGRANMTKQVANGRNIFTAMVNYAGSDDYPIYKDKEDPTTKVADSNDAFEILLKGGYLDDKKLLAQKGSAWVKPAVNSEATAKQVLQGENDWCYVVGLNRTTARSNWPILANAFSPGTTTYVTDIGKKGGEYKGVKAVVVYSGGNAEVEDTLDKGGSYIVRRKDQVQEDAFVPSGEWLSGPEVKVLYPKGS
jgi:prepilin-type N-terminal cleavage/methylation domain-containing protein